MKAARIACWMMALYCLRPVLCFAQANVPAQAGVITIDAIQQDFDSQKYADVIRKSTMALNYKGPSAPQLDRGTLLALKAEAYLRLRQFLPAADTFTLAAKEATDEKDIALDKSTALLIRRSPAGQYTPKSGSTTQPAVAGRVSKAPPIGIVDPETRKAAMAALFEDELKVATPKIQAVTKQPSLPPLMNSINDVHQLRLLELAASGQDSRTSQLFAALDNRAGQLMGDAVKTMAQQVEKISKSASDGPPSHLEESPYGGRRTVTNRNGLSSSDKDTLNEVIDTSHKIVDACEEFAKVLPVRDGAGPSAMARVDTDASKLADRADEVLHANYDPEVVDTPSGIMVTPPQVAPQVPGVRTVPTPRTGSR
jgi:hypothetical protein